MKIQLEQYESGWYTINVGLKASDIDNFILLLQKLKEEENQHFPIVNNYCDPDTGKLESMEFYLQELEGGDNMTLLGLAIDPDD
jgi:hypothetical protein